MNRNLIAIGFAAALLACGGGDSTVEVSSIEPARGSMNGGTRVTITGSGFAANGAPPNIVLIGGGLAQNVAVLDDNTIEATTPAGLTAGPAVVTIANDNGTASAELFEYNQPPTIESVEPNVGVYTGGERIILRGVGFEAEGAGTPFVLFDGVPASDIEVRSDTEIALSAPNGRPLALADIEISNLNGSTTVEDAFRFVGTGLLALSKPTQLELVSELFFIDASNGMVFKLRNIELQSSGIGDLATAPDGTIYGVTARANFGSSGGGRNLFTLDLDTGEIAVIGSTNQAVNLTGMTFVGNSLVAVNRLGNNIGTVDLATGNYAVAAGSPFGGGLRLAVAGGQAYVTTGSSLQTININNGVKSMVGDLDEVGRARAMAGIGEDLFISTALSNEDDDGPTFGGDYNSVISRLNRVNATAQPMVVVPAPIEAMTAAPEVF